MAVYDRWHKAPGPGAQPCKCGTDKHPLYPSSVHKQGLRWQVRWRDDSGKQCKQAFALKTGKNPDIHADAYDAKINRDVDTGDYIDPSSADITLRDFAEDWRANRGGDQNTAEARERRLRLHVYEDPERPGSGKTPKGGVAIGQRRLAELAKRPSLSNAWIQSMPLKDSTKCLVVDDVSAVYQAAMDDGIIGRDPTWAASVKRPSGVTRKKVRPWTAGQIDAMREVLPGRYAIIPDLGAATGARQGEMFGLAKDDIVFLGKDPRVRIRRQVKHVGGRMYFAPVKNRKEHSVPLAESLAWRLARHMELYPPADVTLPWYDPDDKELHGTPVTVKLILTTSTSRAIHRNSFNAKVWRKGRERAGITPPHRKGQEYTPAPEDGCHVLRHTFASVQLAAGIDVVRVAAWLGDTPQTVLRAYAHLMPGDSGDDGRAAIDGFFGPAPCAPDVPSASDG